MQVKKLKRFKGTKAASTANNRLFTNSNSCAIKKQTFNIPDYSEQDIKTSMR